MQINGLRTNEKELTVLPFSLYTQCSTNRSIISFCRFPDGDTHMNQSAT